MLASSAHSSGADATVSADPQTKSNIYYGSTWSSQVTVTSLNSMCDIECTAYERATGNALGFTGNIEQGDQGFIQIQIRVDDSPRDGQQTDSIDIKCVENAHLWPCTSEETYPFDFTTYYMYCGDNSLNGNEECDGTKFGGQTCQSLGFDGGTLSCAAGCGDIIKSGCYGCGDGSINPGEQCDSGSNNGKPCTAAYGSTCTHCSNSCTTLAVTGPYCGDGNKDSPNENCQSCALDAACSSNEACSTSGQCIPLGTNENCAAIGSGCGNGFCLQLKCVECRNSDDCKGKTEMVPTGEYKCSTDYHSRIPLMEKKRGECDTLNHVCTGSIPQDGAPEPCGSEPCQELETNKAQCGCLAGFSEAGGRCLEIGRKELNEPCEADFECKSDFCYGGKCNRGVSGSIQTEERVANLGEEVMTTLALTNELSEDIRAHLIYEVPSGVRLTFSKGASECSAAQCSTYVTIPGKKQESIEIQVQGTTSGSLPLQGKVTFDYGGQQHIVSLEPEQVYFIQCGDGKCMGEAGETIDTCCSDCKSQLPKNTFFMRSDCSNKNTAKNYPSFGLLGVLLAGILLVVGGYFGGPPVYHSWSHAQQAAREMRLQQTQKTEEEKRQKDKAEHERDHIKRVLWLEKKEIDVENPPAVHEIEDVLEKKFDLKVQNVEILREEYLDLLAELEHEKQKVKSIEDTIPISRKRDVPSAEIEKLEAYIEATMARGFTADQISSNLVSGGWPQIAVDLAFRGLVEKRSKKSAENVSKPAPVAEQSPPELLPKKTKNPVKTFCGKCGAELTGNKEFCGKCGAKVE